MIKTNVKYNKTNKFYPTYAAVLMLLTLLLFNNVSKAQQPEYKSKSFLSEKDATICNSIRVSNNNNKVLRICNVNHISVYDVSDNGKVPVMISDTFLIAIEGPASGDNKWNGAFDTYIFSKSSPRKKYLIWTQEYKDGKLDGVWKMYYLNGKTASVSRFENNNPKSEILYAPDGVTLIGKKEYDENPDAYKEYYYENGVLQRTLHVANGKLNGVSIEYYPSGNYMSSAEMIEGKMNGIYRYYYENKQVWVELLYKNGKPWDAIANYTQQGEKRNCGTLKDGNGTVIYYNINGEVDQIKNFVNGEEAN